MLSANVALVVGLTVALVTWTTGANVGFVGVPIAGLLGWCLAPNLRPLAGSNVGATLAMAAGCTLLGSYGAALLWSGDPFVSIAYAVLGIVVFGIQSFLVLIVPATAWGMATSWLAGRALGIGNPTRSTRGADVRSLPAGEG